MKKLISFSILSVLICVGVFSQTKEIIYFKIDSIGIRLNQAGNRLERTYTPGAIAVLNFEKSEFSVLYRDEIVYYRIEIEQDSTSIPNSNTILNRMIKMNAVDSNGNSGLILIFLGSKNKVMKSLIFNKLQTHYYIGTIMADSNAN
jgi:hypothetical protein